MARITIDLDASPLADTIGRVRAKTRDLTPLMKRFMDRALGIINARFKREGPGWPRHAPSTEARRGKGAPILRDKGRLIGSMTGGDGGFARVGGDFLEVGSNVKYARIHNFGGEIIQKTRKKAGPDIRARKSKKVQKGGGSLRKFASTFGRPTIAGAGRTIRIPARRFLPLEDEIMPDLIEEAEAYLEDLE